MNNSAEVSDDEEAVFDDGVANAGAVFRKGDQVIRPSGKHSASVHALLKHLENKGFTGAPRAISLDNDHEHLSFVKGGVPKPPYQPWMFEDATLEKLAQLQRRYHDAISDFVPAPNSFWNRELADPAGIGPVAHNDLGPGNVVFYNNEPSGMIDFDFAAPGRTIWDIARCIRVWAPLDEPASAETYGLGGLDPIRRLRLFCDAYGLAKRDRAELADLLEPCNSISVAFVRQQYESGKPSFVKMWTEYNLGELYEKRAQWMIKNRNAMHKCLD